MSDARTVADIRLAEGAISIEDHRRIVSLLATESASDARRAVDLRLAEGKITATEHQLVTARLSPADESSSGTPLASTTAIADVPSESTIGWLLLAGIGLIVVGMIFLGFRADSLAECRARASYPAACLQTSFGGILSWGLIVAGGLSLLMSYGAHNERQKFLGKS